MSTVNFVKSMLGKYGLNNLYSISNGAGNNLYLVGSDDNLLDVEFDDNLEIVKTKRVIEGYIHVVVMPYEDIEIMTFKETEYNGKCIRPDGVDPIRWIKATSVSEEHTKPVSSPPPLPEMAPLKDGLY